MEAYLFVHFKEKKTTEGEQVYFAHSFSFPYRFKHGTVLSITMEEYNRIKNLNVKM